MLECKTLFCVYNQLPSLGADDLFIIGCLLAGSALLVYLFIDAWKDDRYE